MRIFVAGASGVVGRHLLPKLVERGHEVVATTRNPEKAGDLRARGATPAVMDGLDAASVGEAVAHAEPDVIVHEMTALTGFSDLRHFDDGFESTNLLRTKGTDNLLAAAKAVGVRRLVAQSYAGWPSGHGGGPVTTEEDPLDPGLLPGGQRRSFEAIRHLEQAVTGTASIEGVVLRYGGLYGPGTSIEDFAPLLRDRKLPVVGNGQGIWSFLHIDDAAAATALAVEGGAPGLYNVVDDDPAPVAEWLPYLAECLGAPRPRHIPAWLGRFAIGDVGISMMTEIRGASNAKARSELGWDPIWPTWRDGFRRGLLAEPARAA
jgi:nucleoside-diphosphate-sugar epimerase